MSLPRNRLFWAIATGHAINDMFVSMGPVLLAFLSVAVLPMTNTQIGFAVSLNQLVMASCQPLFGWLADRSGGRWLGAGGVSVAVVMLVMTLVMAQTGHYWLMLLPYMALALGSSAFHPIGALYAVGDEKQHKGTFLALFFFFGQAGLAVGPALVGVVLDRTNPFTHWFGQGVAPIPPAFTAVTGSISALMLMALAAIPGVLWLTLALPSARSHRAANEQPAHKLAQSQPRAAVPWKALGVLAAIIALRCLAQPGAISFFPVLFQSKGWDPAQYGLITGVFWLASGIAGVAFGFLADRFDRRYVIAVSLVLGAPAFFFLPMVDGLLAFVLALLGGALSGASYSVTVLMAQEMIPANKGTASGVVLGFGFGMGAIASFIVGGLADWVGLGVAFQVIAAMTLLSGLLGLALPSMKKSGVIVLGDELGGEVLVERA